MALNRKTRIIFKQETINRKTTNRSFGNRNNIHVIAGALYDLNLKMNTVNRNIVNRNTRNRSNINRSSINRNSINRDKKNRNTLESVALGIIIIIE